MGSEESSVLVVFFFISNLNIRYLADFLFKFK